MKKSQSTQSAIPIDMALKISSFLEVSDISSLGCCSRFWRDICSSDCIWEQLFKERWPLLYEDVVKDPTFEGWRGFYMKQHKEMKDQVEFFIKFMEKEFSQGSEHFGPLFIKLLEAPECPKPLKFGFKDVEIFMFKPKLSNTLKLLGLRYCIFNLRVPGSDLMKAFERSKISHLEMCSECWFVGTWPHYEINPRFPNLCKPWSLEAIGRKNLLKPISFMGRKRAVQR